MNIEIYVFYFFSVLLLFSAANVVLSNNAVKSAIHLVFSFFFSAVLWLILNAEFLSVILILVYVGAVMVLFLFVVMMLDVNITALKEGFVKYFSSGLAVFFSMAILLIFFFQRDFDESDKNILVEINVISDDNTENLGYVLYTEYLLAFEIAAVILLLGIISAITLTHRKSSVTKYQNPSEQIDVKKEERIKILSDEDLK
tara:strand:- start:406 stop:1005 length:600 start_codon:yes stop_codon:yes gene_type:complete